MKKLLAFLCLLPMMAFGQVQWFNYLRQNNVFIPPGPPLPYGVYVTTNVEFELDNASGSFPFNLYNSAGDQSVKLIVGPGTAKTHLTFINGPGFPAWWSLDGASNYFGMFDFLNNQYAWSYNNNNTYGLQVYNNLTLFTNAYVHGGESIFDNLYASGVPTNNFLDLETVSGANSANQLRFFNGASLYFTLNESSNNVGLFDVVNNQYVWRYYNTGNPFGFTVSPQLNVTGNAFVHGSTLSVDGANSSSSQTILHLANTNPVGNSVLDFQVGVGYPEWWQIQGYTNYIGLFDILNNQYVWSYNNNNTKGFNLNTNLTLTLLSAPLLGTTSAGLVQSVTTLPGSVLPSFVLTNDWASGNPTVVVSNAVSIHNGLFTIYNGTGGFGQLEILNTNNTTTEKAYLGVAGGNNDILTGDSAGELDIWAPHPINFSSDGANIDAYVNTSGVGGNGSQLTSLNASALASGTIPGGVLPSFVITNGNQSGVTLNGVINNGALTNYGLGDFLNDLYVSSNLSVYSPANNALDVFDWYSNSVKTAAMDPYGYFRIGTGSSMAHVGYGVLNNPTNGLFFQNTNDVAFETGGTLALDLTNGKVHVLSLAASAAVLTDGSTNLTTTGTIPTAQLGSGTASSSTYLRGDQTWATVSGGSGTVTSVTFTGDGVVDSSTPSTAVTTSGTVTATLNNQAAYTVLNNATGASAGPTFTANPIVTSLSAPTVNAGTDNATNLWFLGTNGASFSISLTNVIYSGGATSLAVATNNSLNTYPGEVFIHILAVGVCPTNMAAGTFEVSRAALWYCATAGGTPTQIGSSQVIEPPLSVGAAATLVAGTPATGGIVYFTLGGLASTNNYKIMVTSQLTFLSTP